MSKRKQTHDAYADIEGDDESDEQVVDVNFDYYNINAGNDYHAIHRLFKQLFGPDAERVETGALTDLVLRVAAESGVGSTIKTEEEEDSDPYAVLTVISCRDHPGLQGVVEYVLSKTSADEAFHTALAEHLEHGHVGLVLSERLVNMPVQVMGPIYRMLSEEIDTAIADGRSYEFTHLLFVSRVYRLTAEEEEALERNSKRQRSTTAQAHGRDGLYAFHGEDEDILEHAAHAVSYGYTDGGERIGVEVRGRAMVVRADAFASLVDKIERRCGSIT